MTDKIEIFKKYISEIYTDRHEEIINHLVKKPLTFRITNKAKTDNYVLENLSEQGFIITNSVFKNSYIVEKLPENQKLSETSIYKDGLIYIQELSSMIPPILLNPKENDEILDIAAAPGSKTTQLSDLANNNCHITAIEKSYDRLNMLKRNLVMYNIPNTHVIHGNGIKFDLRNPQYANFFDKSMVDAPCSSEGRFDLSNPKSYKFWNPKKRREMSKIQKGLLVSAYRMTKPGGTLVYSTCTFGLEENELVIDWFLDKVKDAILMEIDMHSLNIKNFIKGFTTYRDKLINPEITKTRRIIPNNIFGGFYIAKIRKPNF